MGNINIKLLESKRYIASYNDTALSTDEPDYHIIAGEDDATTFTLTKPDTYSNYTFWVEMVNAANKGLDPEELKSGSDKYWIKSDSQFSLPEGMAVAGYGYILIYATPKDTSSNEKVVWMPVKVKVWNTIPSWSEEISEGEYVTKDDFNAFKASVEANLIVQGGSVTFENLPTPSASNLLTQYNITNGFTTDTRFLEGSGHTYTAGCNVIVVSPDSGVYRYDVLSGNLDNYAETDGVYPLMSVGYSDTSGQADEATHAEYADQAIDSEYAEKLGKSSSTTSTGDSETPVYFSDGVPQECDDVFLKNYGDQRLEGDLIIAKGGTSDDGSLTVQGDLTVIGKTISASQESLLVGSTMIVTNNNGANLESLGFQSGLAIRTGNPTDTDDNKEAFGAVYDPNSDTFEGGYGSLDADNNFSFNSGENHPFAFRDDAADMTDGHVVQWSIDGNKLVDGGLATEDIATKTEVENEATARAAAVSATNARIDDIVDGTTTVGRATNDSDNNNIATTYVPWSSVSVGVTSHTIPQRDDNGCIDTATPTNDSNASNKGYTDDGDHKAYYNLGVYDTYTSNGDGTATITRKTGYIVINAEDCTSRDQSSVSGNYCCYTSIKPQNVGGAFGGTIGVSSNGYTVQNNNINFTPNLGIGITNENGADSVVIRNDSFTDVSQYRAICPIYVQFELAMSYTEQVIENQPLNTLPQDGEQWVREEWEKGLNLAQVKDPPADNRIFIGTVSAGIYTISLNESPENTTSYQYQLFTNTTTSTPLFTAYVTESATFTVSETTDLYFYANGKTGEFSLMLNKGSHPYPYVPYNGEIVRTGTDETITGIKTFTKQLQSPVLDGTRSGKVFILPTVGYEGIDPTHDTQTYLKELLKWICKNYPGTDGLWIGRANPNSQGQIFIDIYDTSNTNSEGLPDYSVGLYNDIGGDTIRFWTNAYEFYCRPFSEYFVNSENAQTINGEKTFNNLRANDGMEIYGATPYIDFHYGNNSSDYTTRLINNSYGQIQCVGSFDVSGTLRENQIRVYSPNNPPHATRVSGTFSDNFFISYSDKPIFVTIWGVESSEYGSLWIVTNNEVIAEADGEDGYWGKSGLCVSAFVPAGTPIYLRKSKMGTTYYNYIVLD